MNGNTLTMIGNLTRDVELKFIDTKNGKRAKAEFSIARSWSTGEGEAMREHAEFFNCEIWGPQAENLAHSAAKGTRVIVQGILRQDRWTDKDSDAARQKVYLEVNDVGVALRFATADVTKNARPASDTPAAEAEPVDTDSVVVEGELVPEPF